MIFLELHISVDHESSAKSLITKDHDGDKVSPPLVVM